MIHLQTRATRIAGLAARIAALLALGASAARAEDMRAADARGLQAELKGDQIVVSREGSDRPILVQNASADFRPYIHPLVSPDGRGELTQFRPSHHLHQTGLYWGFMREVVGRRPDTASRVDRGWDGSLRSQPYLKLLPLDRCGA